MYEKYSRPNVVMTTWAEENQYYEKDQSQRGIDRRRINNLIRIINSTCGRTILHRVITANVLSQAPSCYSERSDGTRNGWAGKILGRIDDGLVFHGLKRINCIRTTCTRYCSNSTNLGFQIGILIGSGCSIIHATIGRTIIHRIISVLDMGSRLIE